MPSPPTSKLRFGLKASLNAAKAVNATAAVFVVDADVSVTGSGLQPIRHWPREELLDRHAIAAHE